MEGLSYKERMQLMMNGAISFCTILLAEGVDDSEAAARAAEISAELLNEVEFQASQSEAEVDDEEDDAEDDQPKENV